MNSLSDERGSAIYNVLLGALVSLGLGAAVAAMSGSHLGVWLQVPQRQLSVGAQ